MNTYEQILQDVSIKNKYLFWYIALVNKAKTRQQSKSQAKKILGYVEAHHILPKSFNLGGYTDPDNIVYLTAREHIIAHLLLTKFSVDDKLTSALRAYHCMCFKTNGGINKRFPTTRQLAKARKAASVASSGPRGLRGVPSWCGLSSLDDLKNELSSCVNSGMSDIDIGKKFNISSVSVKNWRKKLSVPDRRKDLRNPESLRYLYVDKMMSSGEIASLIGCSATAVQQYLNRYNIPIREANTRQKLKHVPVKQRHLDILQLSCDEQSITQDLLPHT